VNKTKYLIALCLTAMFAWATMGASGCESDADKVSKNISTDAEQFKVLRKIVGINGITDKVEFEVVGRCSYEHDAANQELVLVCKETDTEYKKHTIGLSDNVFFISTQLQNLKVSTYRTKIILKPQNLIPDLDLVTGKQESDNPPSSVTVPPTTEPLKTP